MDITKTKVLLIDDEESFVAALEKRLLIRDVQVVKAYTGEDGLAKLDEEPEVDIVLLDVKMPGIDGIETLKEIKRKHPLVEVIMLTGHATVEAAIEGMKLGAFDFLMKPHDTEELLAKLAEAKAKKHSHKLKILEAAGKDLKKRRGV